MVALSKAFFVVLLVLLAAQVAFAQNGSNGTANSTINATGTLEVSATPTPTATPEPTEAELLDLEVSYFLEATESSQTSNFTLDGKTYYLAKVAGKNEMIFDSRYQPISDEAEIRRVMAGYAANLPLPFAKADLTSLQTEFSSFNSSWNYCRQVWWEFKTGSRICVEQTTRKLQCWIIFDGDFGASFAIAPATAENRRAIGNGTFKLNTSTELMGSLLEQTSLDFDSLKIDSLKARLEQLKNVTAQVREGYTQFSGAHAQYLTYAPFATDGGLNRCTFNEKALANVETLVDSAKLFPEASALANETIAGTQARLDKGRVRKLAATVEKNLADFEKKYLKAKADFATANDLEPTAITAAYVEITSLSLGIKNSSTYAEAKTKADAFESKRSTAEALIETSVAALVPYVDSLQKINNASATLEATTKIYGQSDPRVNELKAQLSELRSNFELKEADLKHGRPVTTTDFQGLADRASNLTVTANSLPRRENEIDWVLVGGLIVLVALIAGAVFYLRQYKQKQGL